MILIVTLGSLDLTFSNCKLGEFGFGSIEISPEDSFCESFLVLISIFSTTSLFSPPFRVSLTSFLVRSSDPSGCVVVVTRARTTDSTLQPDAGAGIMSPSWSP